MIFISVDLPAPLWPSSATRSPGATVRLTPVSAGRLALGIPGIVPCTPYGCLLLLQDRLGDLSGKDAEFAAELVTARTESEDSPIGTDQAECWSNRLVSDFGVDRLKEVGVTAEKFATNEGPDALSKLSESEQETFTDGFVKCIDMVEMMLSSAAQDGEVTPAMLADILAPLPASEALDLRAP